MNFWSIIWTNEPLQWIVVIVFLIASFCEIYHTVEYRTKDLKTTEEAIKHLTENKNTENIFLVNSTGKLKDWLKFHIAGKKEKAAPFTLVHYPSILARSAPQSFLRFVPTICTALGLLGTFYGIQKGLQGINPGIGESQELLNASKDLFAGMRVAFSNSLVGLGAASLFTLMIFVNDSIRQNKRKNLRKNLDNIAVSESPFKANNESLQANNKAATELAKAAESLQSLNPQEIGIEVGKALTPVFREIREELSALREIKVEQGQDVLQNLITSLRNEVIEPIVERLNQSANLTQQVSQSVQNLTQELGGVSTSLADSIITIQTFQGETVGNLERFAQSLQQTLGQFQNETQGVLQQVAEEIHQGVAESVRGMEAQRNAFEQSADQASVTFRGIREDLQEALTTQAAQQREMLEGVTTQTSDILNQANATFQEQSNTIKTVGVEASNLMRDAKDNLTEGLNQINGTLQSTQAYTREELEAFSINYQQRLSDFFAASVRGMEAQRNAFEQSADQASVTFRGIREDLQEALTTQAAQQREMLEGVATQTSDILNQANATFQEQSNTIKTVGVEASNLMRDAKDNLIEGLGNIEEMLRRTSDMVQTELDQFRLTYQDSLTQFFAEQNQLLEGTLGQQREGLAKVVANLERVFSQEVERRRQLNESMDKIQETVEVVNRLAIAVGLNSEQQKSSMKQFVRELSQEVKGVEQQYSNYANKLEQILQAWSNNVLTSQNKFFSEADSAMAKVSGGLLEAANVLVAAENNNRLK